MSVLSDQRGPKFESISYSPDGKFILASGWKKRVQLWEAASNRLVFQSRDRASIDQFHEHAWSPDSQRFATSSSDHTIRLWSVEDRVITTTLTGHTSAVSAVAWHPGGRRLASGSKDHTIRIWDADSGELTLTLRGHDAPVTGVHWSQDGLALASVSLDGTLRLWDASRAY